MYNIATILPCRLRKMALMRHAPPGAAAQSRDLSAEELRGLEVEERFGILFEDYRCVGFKTHAAVS